VRGARASRRATAPSSSAASSVPARPRSTSASSPGLPVALADPYFRLDLARAAAKTGLDLFPPDAAGR